MKVNADAIRELAKLLDETGLTEIEIADDDKSVRVSRHTGPVSTYVTHGAMPSDPTIPQRANISSPNTVAGGAPAGAITSPMVGTAYRSGEPGAKPFVEKGATVKAGDTVVIIEAMKVMNPIKAEKGGVVTQILVENGQPVEFGDVLMVIE